MDMDYKIYRRILEGDENALDELIIKYRKPLSGYIHSFVKDMDVAEGLMIDTFVELIRHKSKFRGESSLKTYLFTIGRNKALRYIKQRKNYTFVPLEDATYSISDEQSVEDELLDLLRRESVRDAVNALNPVYREVIFLIFFEEMSYKQAAAVLHKSEKQIANLVYRAKKSLKSIILEKEDILE